MPVEWGRLLTVFLSLTDIIAPAPPASLSLQWDPDSQSAHLSVCDSNGHLIVVAWPSSMSDGPQHADVLVVDAQPSPMDHNGPMASVSSSVDLHAESL